MSEVLYQRFKHGEEETRSALYRFLFNSGLVGLAVVALLAVCLVLISKNAL
jgi:hypothetical protein